MKRVKVNFNFKSMALVLFALVLSSNVWGEIADGTYVLCTSTSDLKAGDHYIIANGQSGDVVCISNVSNSNNRKTVAATVTNSKITVASTSTIMTLTLGGSAGSWTFLTDNYAGTNGYLASASSGSNNHCRVITTSTTATISFSDNAAVITLNPHTSRNILRYNSSASCFACYSSGQAAVYLYKKEAASKTLSSISVKTAPSKITYSEGDKFDPTGLVVTKNYSDGSTEDWTYASHASDFTFSPSTSTALTTSNTSVTITVGGKSTTQSITVNAKPKYTVTFYNAGEVVKTVSNVVKGTLFSAIKPTIGTGSGQLNIESCDNNSTHFMGWTTEDSFQKRGSAPSYVADGTAINSNMELRAVWAAEQ